MSEELVKQQLARLGALLSEDRAGRGLKEAPAEPTAEEVGALAAVGYQSAKPEVSVSVYVFPDWSKHREVSNKLKARFSGDEGVYVRTATNGPMLFFAHTRIDVPDGREAEFRLDKIMSAFAGDE